jgi:hypothetical protein
VTGASGWLFKKKKNGGTCIDLRAVKNVEKMVYV